MGMLVPPAGCSPVLTGHPGTHAIDADLSTLLPNDRGPAMTPSLLFNVVWQPWLQKGEKVVVAHQFRSRSNYQVVSLSEGLEGRVVKIYHNPQYDRGVVDGEWIWEEGDALVAFAGRNHWVPRLSLCNLARE